jgi:hypothetical protein
MGGEAFFGLDFLGTFCVKAKSTKERKIKDFAIVKSFA